MVAQGLIPRVGVLALGFLWSLGATASVAAQAAQLDSGAPAIDGAARVSLGLIPLAYEHYAPKQGAGTSINTLGILPSALALNVGYGVADTALVGVQVTLGSAITSRSGTAPADDLTQTNLTLLPYVHYVFGRGQSTRPFLGVSAGLRSLHSGYPSGDSSVQTSFMAGVAAGVHFFLGQHASVDPMISLYGLSGAIDEHFAAVSPTIPSTSEHTAISGFSALFSIGLSLWPGTHLAQVEQELPVKQQAEQAALDAQPQRRWQEPDDGLLVASAQLDGVNLYYLADTARAEVPIALRLSHYAAAPKWAGCANASLVIDAGPQLLPLQYKATTVGAAVRESVQLGIDRATLVRIGDAGHVQLDLCGFGRSLSVQARATAKAFVARLDERVSAAAPAAPAPATPAPATPASPASAATPAVTP